MIAIATKSSIRVKPRRVVFMNEAPNAGMEKVQK
jgi:hypothetical protein